MCLDMFFIVEVIPASPSVNEEEVFIYNAYDTYDFERKNALCQWPDVYKITQVAHLHDHGVSPRTSPYLLFKASAL